MRFLYFFILVVLVGACSTKENPPCTQKPQKLVEKKQEVVLKKEKATPLVEQITDLELIPQNVDYYTQGIENFSLKIDPNEYEKKYFSVWSIDKSFISLQDAMWAHKVYTAQNSYGENLQPLSQNFFDTLKKNGNYKKYLSINKKAITLKNLSIRAMPSEKPVFLDPQKAGEGFPFDYLQNSLITANKPVIISHYSKDKKWAFIESSFTYGWVKRSALAVIKEHYTQQWQHAEQVFITKEGIPLYSKEGNFLFYSRVGMMFALIEEGAKSYKVLAVQKYNENTPLYSVVILNKAMAHKGVLAFNQKNIANIIKEVSKTNYGWGGLYAQRDCSSTLRDFYAPFGVWLPRNSYQQSLSGETSSLEKLTKKERVAYIKKEAKPFQTLLYKKGHIGLYVGIYEEKPIIYQNVWGVKTDKNGVKGRYVVGRTVFSTLELGSNLKDFDSNESMLNNLKTLTKL